MPPARGPVTGGPQSGSRADPWRTTVTKKGPEGLDLPLQSNFINVALKSISRKRHWRERGGSSAHCRHPCLSPPPPVPTACFQLEATAGPGRKGRVPSITQVTSGSPKLKSNSHQHSHRPLAPPGLFSASRSRVLGGQGLTEVSGKAGIPAALIPT